MAYFPDAGGTSLPGVTPDGLSPPGIIVEGKVAALFPGCLLIGGGIVTAVDHFLPMTVAGVLYTSDDVSQTVGSSLVTVNTPGWYRVTAWARLITAGEDKTYEILEGDNALYVSGSTGFLALAPYPKSVVGTSGVVAQGMAFYNFSAEFNVMELQLRNPGSVDQQFAYWISMEHLRPA